MDVVKAIQNYVNKMISEVGGMKVLLLDSETTPIISLVFTQSQLLDKEVYLVDRIDKKERDKMKHLKCICFLRPTPDSIQLMVEELRSPCYSQYHLIFSNILKKSQVERLAEVDEQELVKEVQEFYGDFLAINPDLFSLNISHPVRPLYGDSANLWDGHAFQRALEGMVAVLLSLKKRPLIRYERNSAMAKRLASEIHEAQLFDFRRPDTPPILLILDRKNDPVTPLLNQWTYQAMVHEVLGINNGRVDMSSVPDIRPELKEIVLSAEQDPFYKKNMYLNLGDLGATIKQYVDEYQSKTKSNMKIESISEMKRFVEEYPEFRKLSGNVSKHVTLVSELSRAVEREAMLEVGELEQNLACADQHSTDYKTLMELLPRPNIPFDTKLRLTILYGLRYEKSTSNNLPSVLERLRQQPQCDERKLKLIGTVLKYAGSEQRQEDTYLLVDNLLSKSKNVIRGLQGVENVYTQHTPQLQRTLENMRSGKLKDALYPFVDGSTKDRPQDVIVFIIGGATFAEARSVNQLNAGPSGLRVVLGGTTIHNSKSFLAEISEASNKWDR